LDETAEGLLDKLAVAWLEEMDMAKSRITVYEKPTCTTCRVVKKLLTDKGVQFEAVNYFEQPLTVDTLKNLLHRAGLRPSEAIRTKEEAYKKYVASKDLNEDELIATMVAHPELIQRPIVVKGNKAVLARPTEKLKDLGL
jgi:arsenate reductase